MRWLRDPQSDASEHHDEVVREHLLDELQSECDLLGPLSLSDFENPPALDDEMGAIW